MIENKQKLDGQSEHGQSLLDLVVNVVDMFDQANTDKAIEKLGNRGVLLKVAVSRLRRELNSGEQKTILDSKQVGE